MPAESQAGTYRGSFLTRKSYNHITTALSHLAVVDAGHLICYVTRVFFQATVLSAALKEELQLIEQFSIYANNIDKLSEIIESNVACPDVGDKSHRLVRDYKQLNASLNDEVTVSQRMLYNTMDDLKCIDYKDSLWSCRIMLLHTQSLFLYLLNALLRVFYSFFEIVV